jgi:hypothetical protein
VVPIPDSPAERQILWPGIALAILTAIGLPGGLGLKYLAGHKR